MTRTLSTLGRALYALRATSMRHRFQARVPGFVLPLVVKQVLQR